MPSGGRPKCGTDASPTKRTPRNIKHFGYEVVKEIFMLCEQFLEYYVQLGFYYVAGHETSLIYFATVIIKP